MNTVLQTNQTGKKFRFNCKPVKLTPVNITIYSNNARKNRYNLFFLLFQRIIFLDIVSFSFGTIIAL